MSETTTRHVTGPHETKRADWNIPFLSLAFLIWPYVWTSLSQSVTSTTSSMRPSAWTIVLTATLPVRRSRTVCAAMPNAPRATDRVRTTATRVATRELSVTKGSVWPSVAAALIMTSPQMNAEVRKLGTSLPFPRISVG